MCGGGPKPDDFNKPTPQEGALAEVATKEWNAYLEGKPLEEAYLKDISRDPTLAAKGMQGEAATDLAEQAPVTSMPNGPNGGMSPAAVMRSAKIREKSMNDLQEGAVGQKAAGEAAYLENAMGMQATADTAQAGLARDAVSRNIADAEADYSSHAATVGSLASLAGAGAGMAYGSMRKR